MATLKDDIIKQADWTITAFKTDGYELDYSITSLLEIDRFFQRNLKNGKPVAGGNLSKNFGGITFSIASYITETIIRNVPDSILFTDDTDPYGEINFSVKLPDGMICWPAQRVIKRIHGGLEDGIYPYGYQITKDYTMDSFDNEYWEIKNVIPLTPKQWWKFW